MHAHAAHAHVQHVTYVLPAIGPCLAPTGGVLQTTPPHTALRPLTGAAEYAWGARCRRHNDRRRASTASSPSLSPPAGLGSAQPRVRRHTASTDAPGRKVFRAPRRRPLIARLQAKEVVVVDATRCHRLVLQKEGVGRFVVSHRLHAARLRPGTQTGGLRARAVVPVRLAGSARRRCRPFCCFVFHLRFLPV